MQSKNIQDISLVAKAFFSEQNSVRFDMNLEGMRPINGGICLGGRAGPSVDASNLLHEISHFLEIDEPRMTVRDWGLRIKSRVFVGEMEFIEAQTAEACLREARVFAMQKVLAEGLGFRFDKARSAHIIERYIDGSLFLPGNNEKDRKRFLRDRIEAMSLTYRFEDLMTEFHRRAALIRDMRSESAGDQEAA